MEPYLWLFSGISLLINLALWAYGAKLEDMSDSNSRIAEVWKSRATQRYNEIDQLERQLREERRLRQADRNVHAVELETIAREHGADADNIIECVEDILVVLNHGNPVQLNWNPSNNPDGEGSETE